MSIRSLFSRIFGGGTPAPAAAPAPTSHPDIHPDLVKAALATRALFIERPKAFVGWLPRVVDGGGCICAHIAKHVGCTFSDVRWHKPFIGSIYALCSMFDESASMGGNASWAVQRIDTFLRDNA